MQNRVSFDDFKVVMKGLKTAFPSPTFLQNEYALNLWYKSLQDIPYQTLNRAAQSYIMSNHFPPSIADIRQVAYDLDSPADDLAGEEWAKLMKALGHAGGPEAADYWNRLPEITKEIVGGFSEFREWANTPTVDLMTVQRPMFIKRYEEIMRTQRSKGAVPVNLAPPTRQLEEKPVVQIEQKDLKPGGGIEAPSDMMARLRERLNK